MEAPVEFVDTNPEQLTSSDISMEESKKTEPKSSTETSAQDGDGGTMKSCDDKSSDQSTFKMPLTAPKLPDKKLAAFSDSNESDMKDKQTVMKFEKPKAVNKVAPSPAEKLKQNQTPLPYKEPDWGGPSEVMYSFEILKKGVIIEEIDLTRSFHVFGRLHSCDVPMEHPSLSRYHAVVQHCSTPTEKHSVGWYLYDLDSTHGTWINKAKIKPNTYYRLKVGHVIKFGGSTRHHILQVSLPSHNFGGTC